MALDMMVGIRLAMEMTGILKRSVKYEDFSVTLSFDLPRISANKAIVKFKDFAPQVFRKIRELSNVTEVDYALALGPEQILGNFLLGKLTSLSEKISEGKSGSFFFFSSCQRFMAKTIHKEETEILLKFLPHYYQHLAAHPDSLLVRVFGYHEMDGIPFIVMNNVLDPSVKMDEIYDLKGSTAGRTNKTGRVKKDLDFTHKMQMGTEKEKIMKLIAADAEFLSSCNLLDYSLLLGIRKKWTDSSLPPFKWVCGQDVYHLGIIDIFTDFNIRKNAEHKLKVWLLLVHFHI